jgi:hypothetical protein
MAMRYSFPVSKTTNQLTTTSMPNYCENQLTVTNSTPKLEAFLKEHGLSFEAIVKPNRPENDENNFGLIDAQVSAWGTKWDLADNDQKEAAASLLECGECNFDTAWSPPSEAIRALSELTGASFLLAFYESGCWFWGAESIEDGGIETELSSGESKEEAAEFLVKYMGYDEDDANESVGLCGEIEE